MTFRDNLQYMSLLRFLQQRQRGARMGYVYQGEAIAHLGLANHDELYAFTTPLRDARLVGTGIGVISITPKGEEYLMDATERQELRQRLIAELEQEIGRKARDEVELAKYVAAYTGKPPSSSGVKSFSDTWELASQMGVDPYKLRAIALVLKEEGVAEVMSVMHDRVGVRLKKVDVKLLMDVHHALYDQDKGES